jgi:TolB-like protein/cytochrome c-type biogenesis protein CcmH/NrfG
MRITAQLINATGGHHLWSESYDREVKDIFAVQDEIAKKIITALEVKLTEGEQARVFGKGTNNVEAWALGIKAWKLQVKYSKENNAKAREILERAIEVDPGYPFLWYALAHTHVLDARFGWTKSRPESLKRVFEFTKKALALDPEDPLAQCLLGAIYLFQRKHEKAIGEGQKAIALDPNYADGYAILSQTMRLSGRFEEALELIKKAMRLSPYPRVFYPMMLASAYLRLERYEEALPVWEQILERCRRDECPPWIAHAGLIESYIGLGREEEARAEAEELLRVDPTFSLEKPRKTNFAKYPEQLERRLSALRKAGLPETPPLPLPDKPSIAVLPFTNLSDDPKQEYFVDGMTDDLITDLSKISGLFVIARNSVFQYKGKPVDVKKVSRELGVKHVLEGTVRKAGNQVRINAQLIDASTGGHLWAERYDGKMDDVFALQDKITQKIVTALAVKLTGGEQEQVAIKETKNIAAYDAFLKGWGHYLRHTPEDYAKAVSYFEKATQLDPDYGRAYASMALIYSRVSKLGMTWLEPLYLRDTWLADRQAKKYLKIAMKNPTSTAYRVASFIRVHNRRYEEAIADAERALSLEPNDTGSNENMAFVLIMAGRPQKAIDFAKKAMRLDPHNLANPLYYIGLSYFCLKEFEEAVNYLERALTYSPRHTVYLRTLAAAYGHLGREKEGKAALERSPEESRYFTFDATSLISEEKYPPFKKLEMRDLFEEGWHKAGLGEK